MEKNDLERWLEHTIKTAGSVAGHDMSISPSLAVVRLPSGRLRITDRGQTLAHSAPIAALVVRGNGIAARLFQSVLSCHGLAREYSTLYLETTQDQVGSALFRFSLALMRLRHVLALPNDILA